MIDKGNYIQWYAGYEQNCRAWKEEKVSETITTGGGQRYL